MTDLQEGGHGGSIVAQAAKLEHHHPSDTKKVLLYGFDGSAYNIVTVDSTGAVLTTGSGGGAGGTQYAEDTAHVSGDLMNMAGVVQQAADTALSGDGDRSLLQVDANGFLKVNIKAGAGSGGTAMTDDAAFTVGATSFTPAGGTFRSVLDSVDDGDGGAFAMTATRSIHANLRNNSGTEIGTSGVPLRIDPTGTTTQPISVASLPLPTGAATSALQTQPGVDIGDITINNAAGVSAVNIQDGGNVISIDSTQLPAALVSGRLDINIGAQTSSLSISSIAGAITPGTGATNLGKAEDAVHASGDTGVMALAVRNDAGTALAGTTGDYIPFTTDSTGALRVTGGGGGTQYAEDTAHVSGDMLTLAGVVQQAADAALSADGTRSLLQVDASGFLKVNIKAGAGSGGTAQADKSAFTEGTTQFTPVGGVFNETIGADPTEDQAAAARITAKRAIHVNLRNVAGTEIGISGAPLRIDPTGSTTQPVSGTVTANQGTSPWVTADNQTIADNAAFTDGTSKIFAAGYVFDEVAGTALTENDTAAARIDSKRSQVFVIEDETTRGRRTTVTAANALKVDGSAVTQPISAASLPLPSGAATSALQTQPGVDIGDVTINNASGASAVNIQDGGNSITVDGTVAVTNADLTTIAGAVRNEDTASADAQAGIGALAIRKATPANTSGTDGDYEFLQISAGRLWASATIDTALPTGTNSIGDIRSITTSIVPGTAATNLGKAEDAAHASGDVGVASWSVANEANTQFAADGDYVPQGTDREGSSRTVGNRAHDAADAGPPVKQGGKAKIVNTTDPTPISTDGDRVDAWYDDYGALNTAKRCVVNPSETPTNVETTYDDNPTTATSAAITRRRGCLWADVTVSLTKNGTGSSLEIFIEGIDETEAHPYRNGWQGKWIYSSTSIGSGLKETVTVRLPATDTFQVRTVAVATDAAGNNITLARFNIRQLTI